MVDAYYFCVGGSVGEFAAIARPVGYRCAAREVPDAIERLLRSYQSVHEPEENLRKFLARHTNTQIRELLAGGAGSGTTARCDLRGLCRMDWMGDATFAISEAAAFSNVFAIGRTRVFGGGRGRRGGRKNSRAA